MLVTGLEVIRDDDVWWFGRGNGIMIWGWSVSLPSPAFGGYSDSPPYEFVAHWKAMVSVLMRSPCLPTNLQTWKRWGFGVTASVSLRKIVSFPASFACTLNLSWLQQYHCFICENQSFLPGNREPEFMVFSLTLHSSWSSTMMQKGIQALFHRWVKGTRSRMVCSTGSLHFSFHISALGLCFMLKGYWVKMH